MRYHLFQKIFEKVVKIKKTSFLLNKCLVSIGQHCKGPSINDVPPFSQFFILVQELNKGSSINDVTPIFLFSDPPPSPCHPSYALKITPNCHFLYPPPSPFGVTSFMDDPLRKKTFFSPDQPVVTIEDQV